ncbi:MAG: hypothetical protein IPP78_00690 [Holophagaceae bacterium]|nr:hypothetical protein [Holophagaceae bacterium]
MGNQEPWSAEGLQLIFDLVEHSHPIDASLHLGDKDQISLANPHFHLRIGYPLGVPGLHGLPLKEPAGKPRELLELPKGCFGGCFWMNQFVHVFTIYECSRSVNTSYL